MTHLRQRHIDRRPVTYVTVGVRGEPAAAIVADARSYAKAREVTFGSLVMEALAEYMNRAYLEARQNAAAAQGHE